MGGQYRKVTDVYKTIKEGKEDAPAKTEVGLMISSAAGLLHV